MKAYTRWTLHYFVWNPRAKAYEPSDDFIHFESKEEASAHFNSKKPSKDIPQIELWEEHVGTGGFVVRKERIAMKDTSSGTIESID